MSVYKVPLEQNVLEAAQEPYNVDPGNLTPGLRLIFWW